MKSNIKIKQTLENTGNADYLVTMTIFKNGEDSEINEFEYNDTNRIFPYYNSLINTIRDYEDVHIELETDSKTFAHEVAGNPNRNTRMLEILKNTQEIQGVTIDAINQ